jgi:hypothetical protein
MFIANLPLDITLAVCAVMFHELTHALTAHLLGLTVTDFLVRPHPLRGGWITVACGTATQVGLVLISAPVMHLLAAFVLLPVCPLAGVMHCLMLAATLGEDGDWAQGVGCIVQPWAVLYDEPDGMHRYP